MVPFAAGSLCTAASSDWFSARFWRRTIMAGITAMLAGLGGVLLAVHLGDPSPSAWLLTGPLAMGGLGNGLVIAPNQDFVLAALLCALALPRTLGDERAAENS